MAANETAQGGPPPNGDAQGASAESETPRQLLAMAQQLGTMAKQSPAIQAHLQKAQQSIRQAILTLAHQGPTQNQSAPALPMGG